MLAIYPSHGRDKQQVVAWIEDDLHLLDQTLNRWCRDRCPGDCSVGVINIAVYYPTPICLRYMACHSEAFILGILFTCHVVCTGTTRQIFIVQDCMLLAKLEVCQRCFGGIDNMI